MREKKSSMTSSIYSRQLEVASRTMTTDVGVGGYDFVFVFFPSILPIVL